LGFALAALCVLPTNVLAQEYVTGIQWEKPPIVSPGQTNPDPPSDAVVLFGQASDVSKWENGENWKTEGSDLIAGKGKIISKQSFGDCQLHIEWSAPTPAVGNSQGRGNSGIFFHDIYVF